MRQPCKVDKPVNQGQHLIIPKAEWDIALVLSIIVTDVK